MLVGYRDHAKVTPDGDWAAHCLDCAVKRGAVSDDPYFQIDSESGYENETIICADCGKIIVDEEKGLDLSELDF